MASRVSRFIRLSRRFTHDPESVSSIEWYTAWERGKWHNGFQQQGDEVPGITVSPGGDGRFQIFLPARCLGGKAKRRTHSAPRAASSLVEADADISYALLNVHGIDEANLPVVIGHDE
jgi:hypothetical protein